MSPTPSPASSEDLAGEWELLWSSSGNDFARLRERAPAWLPATSSQIIGEGFSENVVTLGPLRVVIRATVAPETATVTAVGPPYSFSVKVGPLTLPLKFPPEFAEERTAITTLYLDSELKVSQVAAFGERTTPGSVFVHVKRKHSR